MIWAGIDYFGEAVQPWPLKGWENAPINTAGFKKPFFYFLQSRYRDLPMAHIAVRDVNANKTVGKHGWDWPVVESHWNWTGAKNPLKVLVYSNCEEVALYLNNKLLGSTSEKDADQGYFEFRVPFEKGELKAVGNNNGNAVAEYVLNTAGNPYAIRLSTNRALLTGTIPAVSHVIAEVVDSAGVIVPGENFTVRFDVQGAAKIVGVDNGDLWSTEPYTGNQRETRDGKCLLVIKSTGKGEIKVSATAAGLESGELILESKPF